MSNPEGLKKPGPETLEEKIRNGLTVVLGYNQFFCEKDFDISRKDLRHGQRAVRKANRGVTRLLKTYFEHPDLR